jgi:nitrogen fixation protein NifU and related proteins
MDASLQEFQSAVLALNRNLSHRFTPETFHRTQKGANPLCGESMQVFVLLDAQDQIQTAAFKGDYSAITAASAEIACAAIEGMSLSGASDWLARAQQLLRASDEVQAQTLAADLGEFAHFIVVRRYPARIKTALLPLATLYACLQNSATAETITTE